MNTMVQGEELGSKNGEGGEQASHLGKDADHPLPEDTSEYDLTRCAGLSTLEFQNFEDSSFEFDLADHAVRLDFDLADFATVTECPRLADLPENFEFHYPPIPSSNQA